MLAPPRATLRRSVRPSKRKLEACFRVLEGMEQPSRHRPSIERRREPRFSHRPAEIRHHSLIAIPRNLSSRGLALETTTGLRIGGRYRLELVTPWAVDRVEGTVRWCRLHAIRPSANGTDFEPLFLAGLELDAPVRMGHTVLHPAQAPRAPDRPATTNPAALATLEEAAGASPRQSARGWIEMPGL